jgi:transcriptional regulator of heat shock response
MTSNVLPELAPRQRDLLRAVIREFIGTARPVASMALVQRYRLGVSPATVRNELAALEQLGLLTHPHTSAGRVPTDLGYRFFIESLMPDIDLPAAERMTVSHQFRQASAVAAEALRLAASTLVRLTAEAALATLDPAPEPERATWTREIQYDGIDQILRHPEFEERDRVREVVSLLSDRVLLARVLPPSLEEGDVAVTIGSENALEPLRPFALVVGRYGRPDHAAGYVCVVGPTRMDYPRTIAAVRVVGELMSDLSESGGVADG